MKRLALICLAFGLAAVATVGCEKTATMEKKETVTTQDGTTTTTDTHKVESSGSKPPVNTSGEKAK
jgi:hypothetical protein